MTKCRSYSIRRKLPCLSITEYEAKNPRPEAWIPLMNSTVTSLPWDSIDPFICKPRPQYLPRNENTACIWCDSHKVSICNVHNNNKPCTRVMKRN